MSLGPFLHCTAKTLTPGSGSALPAGPPFLVRRPAWDRGIARTAQLTKRHLDRVGRRGNYTRS